MPLSPLYLFRLSPDLLVPLPLCLLDAPHTIAAAFGAHALNVGIQDTAPLVAASQAFEGDLFRHTTHFQKPVFSEKTGFSWSFALDNADRRLDLPQVILGVKVKIQQHLRDLPITRPVRAVFPRERGDHRTRFGQVPLKAIQ